MERLLNRENETRRFVIMKTILIASVLTLFSVGTVSASEITVTHPDNQSKWVIGSEQAIKWKATEITGRMTITLWRGDIKMGVIADDIVPPPPQYSTHTMGHTWKVGDLLGGKALPANNYQIGIEVKGTRKCFKSAPYFEIKEMVFKKFPKAKFWDLSIEKMRFHPHRPPGPFIWSEKYPENNIIYVDGKAVPSDIKHKCWVYVHAFIKMKTPPKSQITKADVSKWGSGGPHNYCEVRVNINNSLGCTRIYVVSMPKFTWADVQTWPEEGKTFTKQLKPMLVWEPNEAFVAPYLGQKRFRVEVWIDEKNQIPEIDEKNNNNPYHPHIVFRTMKEGPWLQLYPPYNHPPKRLIGSTMTIRWRARHIKKRMKILLYQGNNNLIGVIKDNILPPPPVPNFVQMSRSWKVGHLLGGKVAKPGKHYWIMIKTMGSSETVQTTQRHYLTLYIKMKFKKPSVPARDGGPSRRGRR